MEANPRWVIKASIEFLESYLDLPGRLLGIDVDHSTGVATITIAHGDAKEGEEAVDMSHKWRGGPDREGLCPNCDGELYVNKLTVTNEIEDKVHVFCPRCNYSGLKTMN